MPNPHPPCPFCGPRKRHPMRSCPIYRERLDRLVMGIRNDSGGIPDVISALKSAQEDLGHLLKEIDQ